jgi:hypothetical protein
VRGEVFRAPDEITRYDAAKWIGINIREVRSHMNGSREVNESFQIIYSRFFQLIESGELVLEYDRPTKKKTLVRVPEPATPPKRKLMPAIDFASMRLKLD